MDACFLLSFVSQVLAFCLPFVGTTARSEVFVLVPSTRSQAFLDFWIFGFLVFWIFGFLDFLIFGFLEFWIFGILEFWNYANITKLLTYYEIMNIF